MPKITLTKDRAIAAARLYKSEDRVADYAKVTGVSEDKAKAASSARDVFDTVSSRVAQVRGIFDNNGFDSVTGQYVAMSDAVSQYDMPIILPQVIDEMLLEAQQPVLNIQSAFTTIGGDSVDEIIQQYPAVGSVEAEDIAYGQEYPEKKLIIEGGLTIANVGKVGLAAAFEEETLAESRYDLIALHLREMGKALARKKERKCWDALSAVGQTAFDGTTPANSIFGAPSGRGLDGTSNGSVTGDDIMRAWGHAASQGYPFDRVFVNPLAWVMFLRDPVLRIFALQGLGDFYGQHTGSIGGNVPNFGSPLGLGGGLDLSTFTNSNQANGTMTSAPVAPGYMPIPLRFIPSPIIPYNPVTRTTDMVAFAPGTAGVIVQKEGISSGEWSDPSKDIRKIKVSERYGIGIVDGGLGVQVFRNMVVDPESLFLAPSLQPSWNVDNSAVPAPGA